MNTAEIEFLSEQETVCIIPKFNDHRIFHMISGDIGPFRAGISVQVPLWVAVELRKRQKCTIVPPDWMDVPLLEEMLEQERKSRLFTPMPSNNYMGIAHIILSIASEDVENSDKVRTAIKDIWDLRIGKARSSADAFLKGGERHAGVDHLTQLEMCSLRPILLDALDTVYHLNVEASHNSTSFSSNATPSQSFHMDTTTSSL